MKGDLNLEIEARNVIKNSKIPKHQRQQRKHANPRTATPLNLTGLSPDSERSPDP